MSVKVFNSQIGHISSSFFKHVGVSKSLKWKFSWWPWTGSVFNFKKQEIIKLRMPISRFRCFSFQGYLYICRIFLGSPSATRWKTPKKLKRTIAGSVVDSSYRGHIDLCIIRLADCALVLVLRPVLEERWRAGGACLRPNQSQNRKGREILPSLHVISINSQSSAT